MPVSIITSKTRERYELPPQDPYICNLGSEFAVGLVGWWPLGDHGPVLMWDYGPQPTKTHMTVNGTFACGTTGVGGFGYTNTGSTLNFVVNTTIAVLTANLGTLNAWFATRTSTEYGAESGILSFGQTTGSFVQTGDYVSLIYDGANGEGLGAHKMVLDRSGGSSNEAATTTTVSGASPYLQMATATLTSNTSTAVYLNGGGKSTNTSNITPKTWASTSVGCLRQVGGTPTTFSPANLLLINATVHNVALTDAQVARWYDPKWRWDLYYVPGRKAFSFPAPLELNRPFGQLGSRQQQQLMSF